MYVHMQITFDDISCWFTVHALPEGTLVLITVLGIRCRYPVILGYKACTRCLTLLHNIITVNLVENTRFPLSWTAVVAHGRDNEDNDNSHPQRSHFCAITNAVSEMKWDIKVVP